MNEPPQGNRDANVREQARELADAIDDVLPQGWGFFLAMAPLNDGVGRVNYVSNCRREDVLTMLKNLVRQLEENPSGFGAHTQEKV